MPRHPAVLSSMPLTTGPTASATPPLAVQIPIDRARVAALSSQA